MSGFTFGILVILFIIGFLFVLQMISNRQIWRLVHEGKGHFPRVVPGKDREESLKQSLAFTNHDDLKIDELTWHDLNLQAVFQMVNQTYSSIGSEALYDRMHRMSLGETFEKEEALIDYFSTHPDELLKIRYQFAKLGKKDFNYLRQYLKNPEKKENIGGGRFIIFALLPLISIGLAFLNPLVGILLFFGSLIHNVVLYFNRKNSLETELLSMSYLVQTIAATKKIAQISQPQQGELKQTLKPLEGITKFAFSFAVKTNSEAEMFMEYLNMIFLLPFISYQAVLNRVKKHQNEAQQLWQLLGDLEVAGAILNFREAMPYTSQPTFTKSFVVKGEGLYHPLLKEPVANDVSWKKGTLVTGSNASGKSTYVKSVAINCILAQTIHTTLAENFSLPHALPMTSMAIEDNIFKGESYFIAEIKSLQRIITTAEKKIPLLCFVDEILKGTNTIERIAASSTIVHWLAQDNILTFVATHDIELTEILKETVDNIHFSETVTETGITFDYQLKEGPAKTRNALALLESLHYPKEIVAKAKEEANYFETNRKWEVVTEVTSGTPFN